MSEHKHTPGPWTVLPGIHTDGAIGIGPELDTIGPHAQVNYTGGESEANAALIAAAPAMLEALEQLVRWIREPWGEDDGQANDYVISEAYRAISLATGKEPHA